MAEELNIEQDVFSYSESGQPRQPLDRRVMAEQLDIEDVFCFRIRSAQVATKQTGYGRGTKYRINIEQDVFSVSESGQPR